MAEAAEGVPNDGVALLPRRGPPALDTWGKMEEAMGHEETTHITGNNEIENGAVEFQLLKPLLGRFDGHKNTTEYIKNSKINPDR